MPLSLFYHFLFGFQIVASLSFLGLSHAVSPTAKLLPYRFPSPLLWLFRAILISLSCMAYFAPESSVVLTTIFLLMSATIAAQIPLIRVLGEEGILKIAIESAAKEKVWLGLLSRWLPAFFYAFLAIFIFFFFLIPTLGLFTSQSELPIMQLFSSHRERSRSLNAASWRD